MIYPTINDLSKDRYNRYEIALATAKCARMITNEYVCKRKEAERAMVKDGDKAPAAVPAIDHAVRDEKAVKIAIGRIYKGDFEIVHKDPAEQEEAERALLESITLEHESFYDPSVLSSKVNEDEEAEVEAEAEADADAEAEANGDVDADADDMQ